MQNKLIYVNFENSRLVDSGGHALTYFPSLSYYACPIWEIHLIDENLIPVNVAEAVSWQAAVDVDFTSSTEPMVRTLPTGIDSSLSDMGVLKVELDARTQQFLDKVDGKNSVNAFFELRGRDSEDKIIYDIRFRMNALGVIDPQGGEPLPLVSGGVTEADVYALLRAAPEYRFSSDGTSWHSSQLSSDTKFASRYPNGAWSTSVELPSGSQGESVVIDPTLDPASSNPVANSAIFSALSEKISYPASGVSGQFLMYDGASAKWDTVQGGGGTITPQDVVGLDGYISGQVSSGWYTKAEIDGDISYLSSAIDDAPKLSYQSSTVSVDFLNGDYATVEITGTSGASTLTLANMQNGDAMAIEFIKQAGTTVEYSSTEIIPSGAGHFLVGVVKVNNIVKITAPTELSVY